MITELIDGLADIIETDRQGGRLSWVKSVRYGAAQSIATTDMPCLMYNLLQVDAKVPAEITAKFGIYACAAITATKEEASLEAQRLGWQYDDTAPHDRGIIPWLLALTKCRFEDSKGRTWRIRVESPHRIQTDQAGANVRGAIYTEISMTTMLQSVE